MNQFLCGDNMDKKKRSWNYQADSIIKCDTCEGAFQRAKSKIGEKNYCCRKCYTESKKKQTKENHPLYNRVQVTCDTCSKDFTKTPYQYKRSKNHFCSIECKINWVEESQAKEGYKTCSKCGNAIKATPEFFYRDRQTRDGLSPQCKECRNAENLERYPERKAYIQEYCIKNEEKIKRYRKEYYAKNTDKIKANYEKNKNRYNVTRAMYYQKNRERLKEYRKDYSKAYLSTQRGREVRRLSVSARRTRLRGLLHDLTIKQWEACLKHFGFSCAYCGIPEDEHLQAFNELLHQEHFIPVSKGGEFTRGNIIPACRSCNGGKMDKDFFVWYPQQESYCKERETKILRYLNYHNGRAQQLALY